jgi:hypothetical protein
VNGKARHGPEVASAATEDGWFSQKEQCFHSYGLEPGLSLILSTKAFAAVRTLP